MRQVTTSLERVLLNLVAIPLLQFVDVFETVDSIDKDASSGRLKDLNIERDQLSPTDAKYLQLTNEIELEQARINA